VTARRKRPHGDPRKAGGHVAGPGGPFDRHAVVYDATDAVLLDYTHVSMIEPHHNGQPMPPAIALQLGGRINKTGERSEVLYLFDTDGAAAIVSELLGLADRGRKIYPDFLPLLAARMDALPKEDPDAP
jgi:hypothetical protein